MYLVFTHIAGKSFVGGFRYLLLCCDVYRALVNSLCLLTESKQLRRHSVSDYDNNDSSYIAL